MKKQNEIAYSVTVTRKVVTTYRRKLIDKKDPTSGDGEWQEFEKTFCHLYKKIGTERYSFLVIEHGSCKNPLREVDCTPENTRVKDDSPIRGQKSFYWENGEYAYKMILRDVNSITRE